MAIELQLKQTQALSQRMIQSIQILQMTSQELEQYVSEVALENPAIDIKEHPKESIERQEWLNSLQEENHYLHQRQQGDDDYDPKDTWNFSTGQSDTLYDYLWSQLITRDFSKEQAKVLDFMLESLDSRGYLTESISDIAGYFHIEIAMAEHLLGILQSLEPVGVCARDLQECLKLQLAARGLLTPVLIKLVDECLDLIAKNKISTISRMLHLSATEAAGYCQIIRSLNPKPGSAFYNREEMKYIIPDVTIIKFDSHFDIVLNSSSYPDITISSYYQKLNGQTDDNEVKEYLSQKIQQAEWIKQCIAQRGKTLMSVSRKILECQEDFFANGPNHLHPLKLADVAEAIGIHESTVSRAVDNKYLQCSWGVYPMAFFFQKSAAVRAAGMDVSGSTAFTSADAKRALREIIGEESKKKPYSDRVLSEMLTARGLPISRRTVAKYRDEEGIPDASGRKFMGD